MAGRYDCVGGVWDKVKKRYDHVGGAWTQTKKRYDKVGGVWVPSYTSGIPVTFRNAYSVDMDAIFTNLSDANYLRVSINNALANDGKSTDFEYNFAFEFSAPTSVAYQNAAISLNGQFSYTPNNSNTFVIHTMISVNSLGGAGITNGNAQSGVLTANFVSEAPITQGTSFVITVSLEVDRYREGGTGATFAIPWSAFTWLPTGDSFAYQ